MVHLLNKNNSIINHFLGEIRNVDVQGDRLRFKRNLERIGEIAALEISKNMEYENVEITTPLGIANVALLRSLPVLATILRAGLPLHQGLLNYFDGADSAFISAYRRHHKDGSFDIHVEYLSAPSIENKVLIIADPMIATGQSLALTYKALLERGTPTHTHIVAAISSRQGIAYLQSHLPDNVSIWTGAIDEELTSKAYIVPGLGDAGDLAYGAKI
jgi:uracil phosphoribosyltransferase